MKKIREKRLTADQQRKMFIDASQRLYRLFKPPVRIFSIDPSRNSLGWASHCGEGVNYGTIVPEMGISTTFKKVVSVTDQLMVILDLFRPKFILMEDYSYGSSTGREMAGETQGCIKYHLSKRHLPVIQPSPHQVKNFVGASAKSHIMMEVLDKWKLKTKTDDEADAIIQVMIGLVMFRVVARVVKCGMKSDNVAALKKDWRKICKAENLSRLQEQTIFRLIMKKGRKIWL